MEIIVGILLGLLALVVGVVLVIIFMVSGSLPRYDDSIWLNRGEHKLCVRTDGLGVPSIIADTRADAYWGLGYLVARDRLFQIDLLRRSVSGHLSEIYGSFVLERDILQRTLNLQRVAAEVLRLLPADQLEVLHAYADGINAFIHNMKKLPPEFLLLRYTPQKWTAQDCILIGLYVFQDLTGSAEKYKRTAAIMQQMLPADMVAFFTADEDLYPQVLFGGLEAWRPLPPLPSESLKKVLQYNANVPFSSPWQDSVQQVKGSNGWVVGPAKTRDGRTLLANDMHLALTVPNIWYKAALHYGNTKVMGMVIPGLPGVMLGSNGHVSWGLTNTCGDFLDLVAIEQNPDNADEYKTPSGWRPFEVWEEQIAVRRQPPTTITIRSTLWGPVSPQLLMGKPIALHWTLLDPTAINCQIVNMDTVTTVNEAVKLVQNFGAPPMNVMLADDQGHIGWTYCGKVPIRKRGDGFGCSSWVNEEDGWSGYVPPAELPCIIDPAEGFLCTANNRTVGKGYQYVIGYNYSSGYRATRIHERLREMEQVSEEHMFALQLDTTSGFYQFYRDLISTVISPEVIARQPHLKEVQDAVLSWDGRAELASTGIGLLTIFRELLAERILGTYLAPCLDADKNFLYGWNSLEAPLRILLNERLTELVPMAEKYANWEVLIIDTLETCMQRLKQEHHPVSLKDLTWGEIQMIDIRHPFGFASKVLGRLFNMPPQPLAGTPFCIRAVAPYYGATIRLVIAPSHEKDALFHGPGGQSGHPFSTHYKDQYLHWVKGNPFPFLKEKIAREIRIDCSC